MRPSPPSSDVSSSASPTVQGAVDDGGVGEGLALVSAMHITAGVWVNDDEPGILEDTLEPSTRACEC